VRARMLMAVVVLTTSATSVQVSRAASAPVPALAGLTTIAGPRSGRVSVLLPHAASIVVSTRFASRSARVTGAGRIVGFVLHRAGSVGPPALVAVNLRACFLRGCSNGPAYQFVSVDPGLSHTPAASGGQRYVLPRGRYELDLLTDGAPARAELDLAGLGGTVRVLPSAPVPYLVHDVPATAGGGLLDAGLNAGVDHHLVRGGGVFTLLVGRVDYRASAGGVVGACYYAMSVPAVLPACAGGSSSLVVGGPISPAPGSQFVFASTADSAATGVVSTGLSVTSAQLVDGIGTTVAWLDD
jgi:hypothetical protein